MTADDFGRPSDEAARPDRSPPLPEPFSIPAASNAALPERRTWEGYASDFRDLSMQVVMLQRRCDAAQTEQERLTKHCAILQRQRRDDQDRLAAISRARSILEASSAAQASRSREAQTALADRDHTIATLQTAQGDAAASLATMHAEADALRYAISERDQEVAALQASNDELGHQLAQRSAELEAREAANGLTTKAAGAGDVVLWSVTNEAAAQLSAVQVAARRPAVSVLDRAIAFLALRRAKQASRQREWAQAEILYEVIAAIRDEPRFWNMLGHSLREQGKFGKASVAYRAALAHDPTNGERHFMLGLAERGQGNEVSARQAFRQALANDPHLRDVYSELRVSSLDE